MLPFLSTVFCCHSCCGGFFRFVRTLANQQASFQRHASAAHEQQRGAAAEACVCEFARLCVYKGVETALCVGSVALGNC